MHASVMNSKSLSHYLHVTAFILSSAPTALLMMSRAVKSHVKVVTWRRPLLALELMRRKIDASFVMVVINIQQLLLPGINRARPVARYILRTECTMINANYARRPRRRMNDRVMWTSILCSSGKVSMHGNNDREITTQILFAIYDCIHSSVVRRQ